MSIEGTGQPGPGLRERTRRAVGREITAAAMELFAAQGFDRTTVDQIATAAGISRRSFFRYFATKEDVLLGDLVERGRRVQASLADRPPQETPWVAIRAALLSLQNSDEPDRVTLQIAHLLREAPSLRARHLEKQLAWQEMLVPELAARLQANTGAEPARAEHQAAAIVASALACLDVATETWLEREGAGSLEQLWDEAVAAVRA